MLADRLKIARKKAGLSLRELAGRLDPPLSAQAISKYESDQMMPSSSVLVGLAKALGTSLEFLMSGEVAGLEGIEFRKHSTSTAQDRAQVEAAVTEQLERMFAIEDILEIEEPADAFAGLCVDNLASLEEAEAQADRVRQAWNLGGDAIPGLTGLLEIKGIRVIEADLPNRVSGMACHVRRRGAETDLPVIVFSSRFNVERKRFTLAHELGHRIIRSTAPDGPRLEKAIDRFAGAFLVPAAHLRDALGGRRHTVVYEEIKRLKHFYGVSAASLLMRLGQVGILPDHVIAYAFRTVAKAWRRQEPDELTDDHGLAALEKPRRFESLVYRALAERMISTVRAAELLSQPLSEVEAGLKGPDAQ